MSPKDMSMHLYDEKELGNCINFVVAVAGVMLDIPILMVRPTQHKVLDTGRVYYEFHEIKMREQRQTFASTFAQNLVNVQWYRYIHSIYEKRNR